MRRYHTGDLGYLEEDGCLVLLGRNDDQVKIRGYRVDLTEVEAALHGLDSVHEAVAVVSQNDAQETIFTAYVVAEHPTPTVSAIYRALADILPDYAIPSNYVFMESLPTLPTGKVDRRNLPPPDRSRPRLSCEYVPPQADLQRLLVDDWQEVLAIDQVGIHDHFMEIGGDSLRAMQITGRLQALLQDYVYVTPIFDAPTVA